MDLFPLGISDVPVKVFHVPLFERRPVAYSERPDCHVFLVKTTTQPYTKITCWWTREGHTMLKEVYKDLPAFEESNWHGGFVNGRPMINPAVPVVTCGGLERPRILYRVVHDEQPHYGMKARGYNLVKITPCLFQSLVDKHINWQCRDPSPFISVTDSNLKVKRIARLLQKCGKTGLRIVKFHSSGPGWDHETMRLFNVQALGRCFNSIDYQHLPYLKKEYLLESHIPPESIIEITDVADDVYYEPKPKKRKLEDDDSEEETKIRKSTKRSKAFRREN